MFGLSTWEILIILAVALIFVGPDQLPKVARTIGKGVRQVRGAMGKVDDEMRKVVREASAELDDDDRPVKREVDPAKRGGNRTMDYPDRPDAAGADDAHGHGVHPPAAEPDAAQPDAGHTEPVTNTALKANAKPDERDWSQVGKAPVVGQVPQNPLPSTPSQSTPPTEAAPAPDSKPDQAPT